MSVIGNPILLLNQSSYVVAPFGTISDANFVKLIQAAHEGKIDLQTKAGWSVGDKRTIQISAFTGGGDVSHAAQNIDIVISSFAGYENCGCVMQFDFAGIIAVGNRMDSVSANYRGYGGSEMYTTTLPALVEALPSYLHDLLIEFPCKASAGMLSTSIVTIPGNKLALRSEIEVFGSVTYSAAGEGSQVNYYKASSKRKKTGAQNAGNSWWLRSPSVSDIQMFVRVSSSGDTISGETATAYGISPFGCI